MLMHMSLTELVEMAVDTFHVVVLLVKLRNAPLWHFAGGLPTYPPLDACHCPASMTVPGACCWSDYVFVQLGPVHPEHYVWKC